MSRNRENPGVIGTRAAGYVTIRVTMRLPFPEGETRAPPKRRNRRRSAAYKFATSGAILSGVPDTRQVPQFVKFRAATSIGWLAYLTTEVEQVPIIAPRASRWFDHGRKIESPCELLLLIDS